MLDEVEIRDALKPFLFKKVTPNLLGEISKVLEPVIARVLARQAGESTPGCPHCGTQHGRSFV